MAVFGALAAKTMFRKKRHSDDSIGRHSAEEAGLLAAGGATEQLAKAGANATKTAFKTGLKNPKARRAVGKVFAAGMRKVPAEAALAGTFGAGLGAAEHFLNKYKNKRGYEV